MNLKRQLHHVTPLIRLNDLMKNYPRNNTNETRMLPEDIMKCLDNFVNQEIIMFFTALKINGSYCKLFFNFYFQLNFFQVGLLILIRSRQVNTDAIGQNILKNIINALNNLFYKVKVFILFFVVVFYTLFYNKILIYFY